MADVLNVVKMQIKQWKEEKHKSHLDEFEESKSNVSMYSVMPAKKESKVQLIEVTENMARNKLSDMIGEKIIGKVFTDNLKDFNAEQDMEPI